MEIPHPASDDALNSWDWGDFLDFTIDDQFITNNVNPDPPVATDPNESIADDRSPPLPEGTNRVRKRDPRLVCSNFLAGHVPCACPEMDEKLEEEEVETGKKRARTAGPARCQVPGCEADISELKGYHRRHRVCLRCANSSTVVLHGQNKRYCQQCGKFHILSDFDEGKRSCRRKLERHNNRRRRKPSDSISKLEKEPQGDFLIEEVARDDETGKDNLCLSTQLAEAEALLDSEEGHVSTFCSAPDSQKINGDSVISFVHSGETQTNERKDNSKCAISPSYCDEKSAYSSMCPTGRISFKLYDWNPAEFPRRLRHQIFQWLASMPVELEGYIRPGCTILTAFIAMPQCMWVKLSEDPALYVHHIVAAPGRMLSGRGTILVHLNDMIFRVMKGGASVMNVKVEMQAPRLHYVHPTCFEAGKPMEFIACGTNLLQRKFRFLISFAGKYLAYDYCVASPYGRMRKESGCSSDRQLYKIHVSHTEANLFGPAFIEVENESGLSNFIPILIGDENICSEMEVMKHHFGSSPRSKLSQTAFSEFLLDVAWLMKDPASENIGNISVLTQIRRFRHLLNFLISNNSTALLEKVFQSMKSFINQIKSNELVNGIGDDDMKLFHECMDQAREILSGKFEHKKGLFVQSGNILAREGSFQSCPEETLSVVPIANQHNERREGKTASTSPDSGTALLLNRDIVMNMTHIKEGPRNSWSRFNSNTVASSPRSLLYVITTVAVCFGVCAVILHPHKVGNFAISIRRCLFDHP